MDYDFRFFKIWRVFSSSNHQYKNEILVAIAPKVVAAWRVVLTLILKKIESKKRNQHK